MPHLPNHEEFREAGQTKDATDVYDANYGEYKNPVEAVPVDERLPTAQMPKASDPDPFKLGGMSSGGR